MRTTATGEGDAVKSHSRPIIRNQHRVRTGTV